MDSEEKIRALEEEIIELKSDLKESRLKESIYYNIISDINSSIRDIFKREEENERFKLGETFNFKECLINLKSYLDEVKRVYRLRI